MNVKEINKLIPTMQYVLSENVPSEKKGNNVFWQQGDFYLNNEKRQATVTDVKYISKDTVVVAHRAAAKLYLIRIENNSFTLLDTLLLDTAKRSLNPRKRYNNQRFFHPDLMSVYGDIVYISEYTNRCCLVEIKDNKLIYKKVIDLGNTAFHGCFSDNTYAMFGSVNNGCITTLSHKTKKIGSIDARLEAKQRIKTIGIRNNEVILAVDKISGKHTEAGSTADCWIKLYEKQDDELKLLDTLALPYGQADGYKCYKDLHFITMHDGVAQSGIILILKTKNKKLELIKRVPCESFPHGIDIINDQLIYTSYANSSIIMHPLAELLE